MPVFQEQGSDGYRFVIRPNCALSWRVTKLVLLFFSGCLALLGACFAALGAWLVLPFAGLEIAVLAVGFYLSAFAGHTREVIGIAGPVLRVLRGRRRLEEEVGLLVNWARVELRRDPRGWYPSRLLLCGHGKGIEVGAQLVEAEREELAVALSDNVGFDRSRIAPSAPGTVSVGMARVRSDSTSHGWCDRLRSHIGRRSRFRWSESGRLRQRRVSKQMRETMAAISKCLGALSVFSLLAGGAGSAGAEMALNFPEPAAGVAQEIYDIHMFTSAIAAVLLVIIFAVVGYSLYFHRKSRGYQADQYFHESWFGQWSWVIVPVMVLGIDLTIADSAQKTLEKVWKVPKDIELMDVKVIGHQWWWEYEYLDHSVEIDGKPKSVRVESRYLPEDQADEDTAGYLRAVDNPLVLPVGKKVRFLHTSADVLHAFWVPELAVKKDAIPGYVTETWVDLTREGRFSGQCAELCGTWHSRMPIEVDVVSQEKFDAWLKEQKQTMLAAAAEAVQDKDWTMEELMEKGQASYNTKCASCHQITGQGLPPAFPALKGSAIATGPVPAHVDIVLNGKQGTAMVAWGILTDLELAAIITYERNAWGNDVGDLVQPSDVKAARAATPE